MDGSEGWSWEFGFAAGMCPGRGSQEGEKGRRRRSLGCEELQCGCADTVGFQMQEWEALVGKGMCPFISQPCCRHSCEGNINGQRRLFGLGFVVFSFFSFFFFIFKARGLNIRAGQSHWNVWLGGNPSNILHVGAPRADPPK